MIGIGRIDRALCGDEMRGIVAQAVSSAGFDGKRVLVIIPDGTRSMPMPQMFALLQELLRPRAAALDYLVALGTHPVMSDAQLSKLVGQPVPNGVVEGKLGPTHSFNHR